MPKRDRYHAVLSAGAGTSRRIVCAAAVVCVVSACREGKKAPPPPPPPTSSPWLTYAPDPSHPEFAAQVRAITFLPSAPGHYPIRPSDSLPIHLTIASEAGASKLQGEPNGSMTTDMPTSGAYPVRVMAIIGNADTTTLPDLPLQPNMPDSVIVWWVDISGGATNWRKWRSHYVLVDTNHTHQSPDHTDPRDRQPFRLARGFDGAECTTGRLGQALGVCDRHCDYTRPWARWWNPDFQEGDQLVLGQLRRRVLQWVGALRQRGRGGELRQ